MLRKLSKMNQWLTLCLFATFFACVHPSPQLVFANRKDIRLVDVKGRRPNASTTVVANLEDAVALDFYHAEESVFWSDIGVEMIKSMRLGHPDTEKTVVSAGLISPDGLACDWLARKLYWTDSETNRIEVSNLDGSYRKVLFWKDLDQPRAIALVPMEGLIFWTDWGDTPKIERAGMDGDPDSRKIIVNVNISWPNGLTVDYDSKRVYWADAKLKFISSIDFDGNNRRFVVDQNLAHPFALTLYGDMLYWTDWVTKAIHGCNKNDGSNRRTLLSGNLSPMDIHSYSKDRQPAGRTPCDRNNGGCSHLCLMSPKRLNYSCACPTGVRLLPDKHTCADGSQEILLLARKTDIRKISLDTPDYTDLVLEFKGILHTIAIDYNPKEGFVYWTDDEARVIRRAYLNGTHQQDLISTEVHNPDGIAVDWIAGNLYWTDAGTDRIEVARLNGTSRRILIAEGLDEPRAIVLEPTEGYMYWTDWGPSPKIERAALDGSQRQVLVDSDLGWPNGLALDYEKRKLYWGDAKKDRIEYSDVDGKNRKVLVTDPLPHIFGFTLLGNYIYWTDWQRRSIERINKLTGLEHEVIVDQLPDLMGLKAANVRLTLGTNPCARRNGGCSHLCLNRPANRYVCSCPMGQELAADLRTCIIPEAFLLFSRQTEIRRISLESHQDDIIPLSGVEEASALDYDINDDRIYWTDTGRKIINRAFMNGSHVETVVEFGLDSPQGMAVDWVARNLYWADMGTNRIEVSRLDGSSRYVLIWKELENPHSLAINPCEGHIYWSDWATSGCKIERAAMDGSQRRVLMADMGHANGLTIDYSDRRLYWSDIDSHKIESSDLQGENRRLLVVDGGFRQPRSLTQYQDFIYWTDWSSDSIERANKTSGQNRTRILGQVNLTVDILVFHKSRQAGWNHCQINNGGCSHLCLAFPEHGGSGKSKKIPNYYRCACPTHFELDADNKTCIAPTNFLLFSQKNSISRIVADTLDSPDIVLPIKGLKNIKSLEYNSFDRQIYWIDGRTHTIRKSLDNGTRSSAVVALPSEGLHPYSLAVDPFAKVIYWSCAQNNVINVTRIDGSPVGVVVSGEHEKPRDLCLYPQKGLLFWVNIESPVKIKRANMDGLQRSILVSTGLDQPLGLTIDPTEDLLYWADPANHKLESIRIDGQHRKTLLIDPGSQPIALTLSKEFLYWADKEQQTIERMTKMGKDRTRVLSRVTQLSDLTAVTDQFNSRDFHNHPCFIHNGGCSHICMSKEDKKKKCSCPIGLTLSDDEKTCISPPTCSSDQFACISGKIPCIPDVWRCDGVPECEDQSDEQNCPKCKEHEFRCHNGDCIDRSLMCEKKTICKDNSQVCCEKDEFLCPARRQCIKKILVCNGHPDCSDGYDEKPHSCDNFVGFMRDGSNTETSTTSYTIFLIIGAIVFVLGAVGIFYKCRKKSQNIDVNEDALDMMAAKPLKSSSQSFKDQHSNICVVPPVLHHNASSLSTHRNSFYDRSRLTGASSSSSGRTPYPQTLNPPPSPVTSHATYSRCCSSVPSNSLRSNRHYRSRNRPPPPTPCSTDVCDDSEPYNNNYRHRPYDMSQTELSYDSDQYPPPPPTPWSHYLSDDNCGSYSPSTERSFCKPYPPPPSPAPLSDC